MSGFYLINRPVTATQLTWPLQRWSQPDSVRPFPFRPRLLLCQNRESPAYCPALNPTLPGPHLQSRFPLLMGTLEDEVDNWIISPGHPAADIHLESSGQLPWRCWPSKGSHFIRRVKLSSARVIIQSRRVLGFPTTASSINPYFVLLHIWMDGMLPHMCRPSV